MPCSVTVVGLVVAAAAAAAAAVGVGVVEKSVVQTEIFRAVARLAAWIVAADLAYRPAVSVDVEVVDVARNIVAVAQAYYDCKHLGWEQKRNHYALEGPG